MEIKRYGSSYHICIRNAVDLFNVVKLDPALWIATSAPSKAFNIDSQFIACLDKNNNQRIIFDNIIEEINWLKELYVDHSSINISSEVFDINSINTDTKTGKKILSVFNTIINKQDTNYISLSLAREVLDETIKTSVSENGVVTPSVAVSEKLRSFIQTAIIITKGTLHPSGDMGLDQNLLDSFCDTLTSYAHWVDERDLAVKSDNSKDFLPFGDNTESYYLQYKNLQAKIDQYYSQCKSFSFSRLISDKVEFLSDVDFTKIDWQDLNKINQFLQAAPLAKPNHFGELDYTNKDLINPNYYLDLNVFLNNISQICEFDKEKKLTESKWVSIKKMFSLFGAWFESNPSSELDHKSRDEIREYQKAEYYNSVCSLIDLSVKTSNKLECLYLLEKAILYQKYMLLFVRNFIGFSELYTFDRQALFEKGSLVIDGVHLNFSIDVENVAAHKSIAANSSIFILYLEITKADKTKYNLAVPVTRGTKRGFIKGKRGVLIDIEGVKHDAVISDIIVNPISLREAILEPFSKIKAFFVKKIDSGANQSETNFTKSVTDDFSSSGSKNTFVSKASGNTNTGAILLGGGVAIAALGSSITYIVNTIASASLLNIIITIGVIVFAFAAPIIISGILKLRRRDITPILEGSGWAINSRMRLTRKISKVFTQKPKWPKGTKKKRS